MVRVGGDRLVRERWVAFALMVLAALAFTSPALRLDRTFAAVDVVTSVDPYFQTDLASGRANPHHSDHASQLVFPVEFWASVRDGDVQWWEPDIGGGTALGAGVWNRVLSPFHVATFSWLPPAQAITASVFLALLAAQFGTWWFVRRLGVAPLPAALAGVVYGFSGASVGLLLRILEVHWFPVVLALAHGTMTSDTRVGLWRVGLVFSTAFLLLGGFPGGAVFALVGLGVVAAGLAMTHRSSGVTPLRFVATAVSALAGAAIASVQLIPSTVFLGATNTLSRDYHVEAHIGIVRLAEAVVPGFFGSTADGSWWWSPPYFDQLFLRGRGSGNPLQASSALGVVALSFAVAGARRARSLATPLVVVGVGLVGTGISLAHVGGPLLWLAQKFPFLDETDPARARFLLTMGVAVLCAGGFDAWLRSSEASRATTTDGTATWPALTARLAVSALLLVLGVGLAIGVGTAAARGHLDVVGPAVVTSAAVLATSLAIRWNMQRVGRSILAVAALIALAAGELIAGQWGHQPAVAAAVYPEIDVITALPGRLEGRFTATKSGPPTLHATVTLDRPDARLVWPGSGAWEDLLALADPLVVGKSKNVGLTYGIPSDSFDPLHPSLDRLGISDVLVTTGGRPLALHGSPGFVPTPLAADADGVVFDLPAPDAVGSQLEGAEVAWRWVRSIASTSCAGRVDVVVHHNGRQVARRRMEVAPGAPLDLAVPDLPAGRVRISALGCPLQANVLGVFRGATDAVSLASVEGFQRYTNHGVRPIVDLTTDVVVLGAAADRLALLAQEGGPVVVSTPFPGDLGRPDSFQVAAQEPDVITVDAEVTGGMALLVVRENLMPGWSATIDGKRTAITRTDHAFMGVWVPEGAHRVVLSYQPEGLRAGAILAALGLLVAYALLFWPSRRGSGRTSSAATGPDPKAE